LRASGSGGGMTDFAQISASSWGRGGCRSLSAARDFWSRALPALLAGCLFDGDGRMAVGQHGPEKSYQRPQIDCRGGPKTRRGARRGKEELALIYQAKGLPKEQAAALGRAADGTTKTTRGSIRWCAKGALEIESRRIGRIAVDRLARPRPSFFLFAFRARSSPVAPFFLVSGAAGDLRRAWRSAEVVALSNWCRQLRSFTRAAQLCSQALRQLLIGYAAAGITFGNRATSSVSSIGGLKRNGQNRRAIQPAYRAAELEVPTKQTDCSKTEEMIAVDRRGPAFERSATVAAAASEFHGISHGAELLPRPMALAAAGKESPIPFQGRVPACSTIFRQPRRAQTTTIMTTADEAGSWAWRRSSSRGR